MCYASYRRYALFGYTSRYITQVCLFDRCWKSHRMSKPSARRQPEPRNTQCMCAPEEDGAGSSATSRYAELRTRAESERRSSGFAATCQENANYLPLTVNRWAARVSGVGGCIGLDRVVGDAADNPFGDCPFEAVGTADEDELVSDHRRDAALRLLPECRAEVGVGLDHGEVVRLIS